VTVPFVGYKESSGSPFILNWLNKCFGANTAITRMIYIHKWL